MASAVETIADELYALPPGEFTAARDARAAQARSGGYRELAAAIKRLRRPTTTAWLVNLLVRERRDLIRELLELGEATRAAQANLAGDELRRLSQASQRAIAALAQQAWALARAAEQPVSDNTDRELRQTLEAAFADPTAGAAVLSAHLTTALQYSGLGSIDVGGAVAVPMASDVADAQAAVQEARAAATEAARVADEADKLLARARADHDRLDRRLEDRSRELERLRAEYDDAAATVQERQRARDAAERGRRVAERRAVRAQESLERLQSDIG